MDPEQLFTAIQTRASLATIEDPGDRRIVEQIRSLQAKDPELMKSNGDDIGMYENIAIAAIQDNKEEAAKFIFRVLGQKINPEQLLIAAASCGNTPILQYLINQGQVVTLDVLQAALEDGYFNTAVLCMEQYRKHHPFDKISEEIFYNLGKETTPIQFEDIVNRWRDIMKMTPSLLRGIAIRSLKEGNTDLFGKCIDSWYQWLGQPIDDEDRRAFLSAIDDICEANTFATFVRILHEHNTFFISSRLKSFLTRAVRFNSIEAVRLITESYTIRKWAFPCLESALKRQNYEIASLLLPRCRAEVQDHFDAMVQQATLPTFMWFFDEFQADVADLCLEQPNVLTRHFRQMSQAQKGKVIASFLRHAKLINQLERMMPFSRAFHCAIRYDYGVTPIVKAVRRLSDPTQQPVAPDTVEDVYHDAISHFSEDEEDGRRAGTKHKAESDRSRQFLVRRRSIVPSDGDSGDELEDLAINSGHNADSVVQLTRSEPINIRPQGSGNFLPVSAVLRSPPISQDFSDFPDDDVLMNEQTGNGDDDEDDPYANNPLLQQWQPSYHPSLESNDGAAAEEDLRVTWFDEDDPDRVRRRKEHEEYMKQAKQEFEKRMAEEREDRERLARARMNGPKWVWKEDAPTDDEGSQSDS